MHLNCARCSFKERNRVTQKRYRERQKSKLADSEDRVAELTEQLSMLRNERVHHVYPIAKPMKDLNEGIE